MSRPAILWRLSMLSVRSAEQAGPQYFASASWWTLALGEALVPDANWWPGVCHRQRGRLFKNSHHIWPTTNKQVKNITTTQGQVRKTVIIVHHNGVQNWRHHHNYEAILPPRYQIIQQQSTNSNSTTRTNRKQTDCGANIASREYGHGRMQLVTYYTS